MARVHTAGIITTLGSAIFAVLALHTSVVSADDNPQAEILHWWSSEAESKALHVFIDSFVEQGGHYYNSSKKNQNSTRNEAIGRMSKGYSATFTQWAASRDIQDFHDYGLIRTLDEANMGLAEELRRTLPSAVLDAVTHKDQIVAVPLNVHGENWMWYSTSLLNPDSLTLSGDWNSFLQTGEKLAEQEIPLLAVGDQNWQVRILFTSVMLGVSRDLYREFFLTMDPSVTDREELTTTLRIFNALAKYSHSFGDGNWDEQLKAVADDRAATNFMGDWAKGELVNLGLEPGKQFGCMLTASDNPSVLMGVDTLILGVVTDPAEIKGQELMLGIVTDPDINLEFNQLKGSASPFKEPSEMAMDECSKQVYELMNDDEALIPPYATNGEGSSFIHILGERIYEFWKKSSESDDAPDMLVASMVEQLATIFIDRANWAQHNKN